jgi:O-antigen/teichoic acid export membrane protein
VREEIRTPKPILLSETRAENLWGSVGEPAVAHQRPSAPPASGAREFVLDTAVVAAAQFLLKFRGLIAIPLIVKILGTAQYGVWVQTLALIDFSSSLVGLNLYHPLVRFLAEKPARGKSIYSTLMTATAAVSLAGSVVVFVTADAISRFILGDAAYGWHIRAAAILVLCYNVRLFNFNAYRATGRLKERSLVELLSTFGLLLSISLLLWNGRGLLQVFIFMAVWESVLALALTLHLSRIVGWGPLDKELLRTALRYALPLVPAGLSIWMLDRGDRLVIGFYLGPKAVGIYSANYAIAGLLMILQTPLQMTLLPKISFLWKSNRESALRYISVSNKLFLTFAIPFVIGLPFVAGKFLARIANEEIGAGGGWLTFFIAAGVLLWGVSVMQTQIFYGAQRTLAIGVVTVTAALLNLVLNVVVVPWWGILGSAFSTLICYLLSCVVLCRLSRETARMDFHWRHIMKCLAAALLMALALKFSSDWAAPLVLSVVTGAITYFAVLWLLRAIGPVEKEWLRSLMRGPATVNE